MFDTDQLVADCQAAIGDPEPRLAVKAVLERALADPASVAAALPVGKAEIGRIHVADDLTLIKVVWAPGMTLPAHNHLMWAAIAIYGGQEDNTFYRRDGGTIVESGGKTLHERDIVLLGDDAIHSVHNPLQSYTAAIHVYGGNFFATPRSEWPPPSFEEKPFDGERAVRYFDEANARQEA